MNFLHEYFKSPYAGLAAYVAAVFFGSLITLFLIFKIMDYYQRKHPSYILSLFLRRLRKPLYAFVPTLFLSVFTPILELTGGAEFISTTVHILVILFFAWLLIVIVRFSEDIIKYKYETHQLQDTKGRALRTQMQIISRIAIGLIFLITVALVFTSFDNLRQIGVGLLTSAGIVSVIVGFAAQKTLGSMMAGFQIAFTQALRIDDVVIVEGEWGQIEEITLTYVVIRIWDKRRLILPISYFVEKPFQNWTLNTPELLGTVMLHIDLGVDVDVLRREFKRILESTPYWDKKDHGLQITDSTDKTMLVRLLMSARNAQDLWELRCLVREKLLQYIRCEYPQGLPRVRSEPMANDKEEEHEHGSA